MLLNPQRALRIMKEEGLDALVATTPENIFYLSEFVSTEKRTGSHAFVLATADALDHPQFVLNIADIPILLTHFPVDRADITPFGSYFVYGPKAKVQLSETEQMIADVFGQEPATKTADAALASVLQNRGLAKSAVGVDEGGTSWSFIEGLQQQLPGIRFRPAESLFRQIRSVKTEEEVRRIRKALEITEAAMLEAMRLARVGITERSMARALDLSLVNQGACPRAATIGFGPRGAHGQWPGEVSLQYGDVIRFDVGCVYGAATDTGRMVGYVTDVGRTVVFGESTRRMRDCHSAVMAGVDAVEAIIRPGVEVRVLFQAGVEAVRKAGIRPFDRHTVGHSIGLETYEYPVLRRDEGAKLEAGMVLNIEAPYNELGLGGFLLEDTVLVQEDGFEMLTALPRGLTVLH